MAHPQNPNGPRLESPRSGKTRVSLCSTCCHGAGCWLRGEGNTPVAFCEEFELDAAVVASAEPVPLEPSVTTRSEYQGLCGNCLNQGTCHLAGCEGGIWHCEEYQ